MIQGGIFITNFDLLFSRKPMLLAKVDKQTLEYPPHPAMPGTKREITAGKWGGGGGGAYSKLLNFTTCSKEDMAEGAWLWGIFQVD